MRTVQCGVSFRPGFKMKQAFRQSSMDRKVWNQLLEVLKQEHERRGYANCSKARISKWYTEIRHAQGTRYLRDQISQVTRNRLYELGNSFELYQTSLQAAAYDDAVRVYGVPEFRHRGNWDVSLPLTITRDNTQGSAQIDGRELYINKLGTIHMSRAIPAGYTPRTARLTYRSDGRWRLTMSCDVQIRPLDIPKKVVGIDRNIGNIATSDGRVIQPPPRVVDRMEQYRKTKARVQRQKERKQKPSRKLQEPGSKRWHKSNRRLARIERKMADTRLNITHKQSRVIADSVTDPVLEQLDIQGMTKSAKGTKQDVAFKTEQNRRILDQNWYELDRQLQYKTGTNHKVDESGTSTTCHICQYSHDKNRRWRQFRCRSCGYTTHADINAAINIEARHILCSTEAQFRAGTVEGRICAQGMGRLDVEGSSISTPAKRQTRTGSGPPVQVVTLWDDV